MDYFRYSKMRHFPSSLHVFWEQHFYASIPQKNKHNIKAREWNPKSYSYIHHLQVKLMQQNQ